MFPVSSLSAWSMSTRGFCQALLELLRRSFLIVLSAVYLLGQVCAAWGWNVLSPLWLGGFVVLTITVWGGGGRRLAVLVGCLFVAFSLANVTLQRVMTPHFPLEHLRHLALPQKVTVEGWLYREPERLPNRGRLYVETLRVWQDGAPRPATGRILVTVRFLTNPWHYGDRLRLSARLRTPRNFYTPGSFDYEGYLARRGVYLSAFLWDDANITRTGTHGSRLYGRLEQARRTIGTFFDTHGDHQTAAVLRALIIGDTGRISKDLRETFSRAGVAHVVAISGLHLGLVAAAAYGTWWWVLGRSRYVLLTWSVPKLAALLTVPPVLLYAGLSGGKLATWRAVVMVLVYLVAILLDRQHEVYRSLALAALVISWLWPGAVLDVSFQLSFLAMLTILLGMARFSAWWTIESERWLLPFRFRHTRVLRWGATYVAVSVWAVLGTAAVIAAHFNQVAVAGLFANLLVIPLLGSAAVILGLVAAGLVFLHTGLASVVLLCAGFITQIGIWLVEAISAWPWAAFAVVTPTLFELVLLYGLLACLLFSSALRLLHPTLRFLLPVCVVALLTNYAVWTWYRYFRQDLRVTFLDVGQGDAAVVEFPGSHVMVIDGGGFVSETFDSGEAIVAPFLWSRKIGRIDTLVLSHPQLDHYGGLAFLTRYFTPREFWFNGEQAESERFSQLHTALKQAGVTSRILCQQTPAMEIAGVRIEVLHPPCQPAGLGTNNTSLVLRLSHGAIDVLFTGDIEATGERALLSTNGAIPSEILKVPHHGSRSSSTPAFVSAVSAQVAVASLGFHNRYRFPAPEVMQRYIAHGGQVLRTDQSGAITIVSTGQHYTVEIMRSSRRSLARREDSELGSARQRLAGPGGRMD